MSGTSDRAYTNTGTGDQHGFTQQSTSIEDRHRKSYKDAEDKVRQERVNYFKHLRRSILYLVIDSHDRS